MTLRWNRVFKYSSCVQCVLRQEWGIQFFDTCSINNARHLLSAICSRDLHVNVSRWLIDNYMEVSRTSFRARLWFFGRWLVRSEDVSFRSGNKYVRMVAARGEWTNTFQVPLYPIPDCPIPFGEQICQTASPRGLHVLSFPPIGFSNQCPFNPKIPKDSPLSKPQR